MAFSYEIARRFGYHLIIMTLILGIESTCDETAAAVVADGRRVLSNVVSSQVELHARYRGVVPEIASRAHIENILPVVADALTAAFPGQSPQQALAQIDAIAVASRPGLIGSLLIGVTAAKTLAWTTGKPLISVDHVQGHLYSVLLDSDVQIPFPSIGLVASGGHTALYEIQSLRDIRRIGATIDDAVGEAYDKVAAILGLPYPGGPPIDRLATQSPAHSAEHRHSSASATSSPAAASPAGPASAAATTPPADVPRFPRSMLGRDSLDFSFSGLKTSVLYHVRGFQGREHEAAALTPDRVQQVAAAFQEACIDVLLKKLGRALRKYRGKSVVIGGGVSANRGLRQAIKSLPVPVFMPPLAYCTDNAAMIAGLAHPLYLAGEFAPLDLDAQTASAINTG